MILIRHCSASGQEPDAPLTAAGVKQAEALADALLSHGIRTLISSDYRRALDTARPLAERAGVEIRIDEGLRERNLGTVEAGDWLKALERAFEDEDFALPGGESSREAMQRGRSVLDEARESARHPVALVTHGNLLTLILRSFDPSLGFEFWRQLRNPDVFVVTGDGTPAEIRRVRI